jgi:hypothetical protein
VLSIEAQTADVKEFALRENARNNVFYCESKTAKVLEDLKLTKWLSYGKWKAGRYYRCTLQISRNSVDVEVIYLLDTENF